MPRLTRTVITTLALAVLVVSVAAAQGSEKPTKQVVVTAVCPNNSNGPLSVTVHPWTVVLDQGDRTRWRLNTSREQSNSIQIEAKDESGWPYPTRLISGAGEVETGDMKPEAKGDYTYNITIYCGEDKVVVDPRVRVGP
jgi:hypothetical protein